MRSNEEILQIVLSRKSEYEQNKKKKTRTIGAIFMVTCITASSVAIGTVYKQNHAPEQNSPSDIADTTNMSTTVITASETKTPPETTTADNIVYGDWLNGPYESCIIPKWEDRKDEHKYITMNFNSIEYTVGRAEISQKYLDKKIGTAEITGQDLYTEKIYKKNITVFKLVNISENCAVGVIFDDGTSYAYINADYMPKNLGQLITDLSLKHTLTFGEATYEKHDNNQVRPIVFSEIKPDIVWSMLLNNEKAVCEKRDVPGDTIIFSISVTVDELGYKQMGLWITEQGYIGTNLFETGKYFYIGKDRADKFIDYAMQNFPHRQLADVTVFNNPIEE